MTIRILPSTADGPTVDGATFADGASAANAALWSQATCTLVSITGTGNAIVAATDTSTLTPSAPITAYARGMRFFYAVATTNVPGSGVTINIDGVGVRNVVTRGGNGLVGYELEVGSVAELIYDGSQLRFMNHYKLLNRPYFNSLASNQNGINAATAQTWFPGGGPTKIAVTDNTAYLFDGTLLMSRSAGTTSHTISITFGGTAIFSGITLETSAATSGTTILFSDAQSVPVIVTAAITTPVNSIIKTRGIIRVTNGGSLAPQFQYSAAPGGVPTIFGGTFFKIEPWGSPSSIASNGPWA